jgi:hypothetical protein
VSRWTIAPTIIDFCQDPQLLGLTLSPAQETLLRGAYGLPLTSPEQLAIWRLCTGRMQYLAQAFGEVTVMAGARSGKDSRIAAPILLYEALFGGHEAHLARGERGILPLVAQDAKATRIAFGYVKDYLTRSSILASQVEEEPLASEIRLTSGMSVYCFPSSQRSLRGWSIPAAVMDELAFSRLEGQGDSDVEIQTSIRRGMLGFPGPRLVKVSTPYMKSGVLHEDFQRGFGQDDPDLLAWRAPTSLMNPSITTARLDRERRLDPAHFAREYEAEFAEDIDALLPAAWVEGAVCRGRFELSPRPGFKYVAACDPSGGRHDAFALSVVHLEDPRGTGRIVQDVMRAWERTGNQVPDLVAVVREIAAVLKRYECRAVWGDRYSAEWVRQAFRSAGIAYLECALDRSECYLEVEPLFSSGRLDLLDHPKLARQFKNLQRRYRPGGKVVVDHPGGAGQHDDYSNALAMAAAMACRGRQSWLRPAVASTERPTVEVVTPAAPVVRGIRRHEF